MKPVIGITCGMSYFAAQSKMSTPASAVHELGDTYIAAIERSGGVPVIIPCYLGAPAVAELAGALDGILFSGGGDVDPLIFGQRADASVTGIQPRRDTTELELARHVLRNTALPTLGICRGVQLVNVAMGGDLVIDLPTEGKLAHRLAMYQRHMGSHAVSVSGGSRLAGILGQERALVNSYHHQAVKTAAPGLHPVAWSEPDGVIEALEGDGDRFVLLLQWHPEGMQEYEAPQREIFREFIRAAQKFHKTR